MKKIFVPAENLSVLIRVQKEKEAPIDKTLKTLLSKIVLIRVQKEKEAPPCISMLYKMPHSIIKEQAS